ncbi:MAG: methylated-DNA--[protein]-cysteine S-methyltransferase [Burkholderiaceae bacterium]|nr:methylated-DNA--[protein]-cysteine S-methyltransferase [Burkholderiaceae bacterium]
MNLRYTQLGSPLGPLTLVGDGRALVAVDLLGRVPADAVPAEDALLAAARRQLEAYFAGARTAFNLPLAPRGTAFQRQGGAALQSGPYGTTVSYAALARRIGRPTAARAVGMANGANPLPIVVPCHRVIGADGSLTGFSAGLARKRWLLAHEAQHASPMPLAA